MRKADPLPATAPDLGGRTSVTDGPLNQQDFELLTRAGQRSRALRRATKLATINGVSLLVCAFACLLFAPFDPWLLCTAIVLGASGAAELRGARLLRELDRRAPRWLATNQLALLGAIAIYCTVNVVSGLRAGSGISEVTRAYPDLGDPVRDALQSVGIDMDTADTAYRGMLVLFYGVLFAVSALYQGACAYYYATRAALLHAQRTETPAWVLEAERRLHA